MPSFLPESHSQSLNLDLLPPPPPTFPEEAQKEDKGPLESSLPRLLNTLESAYAFFSETLFFWVEIKSNGRKG